MRRRTWAGVITQGPRCVVVTLGLLASLLALLTLYEPLNVGPQRVTLRTPLDGHIPLVKVMVIPYLSLFAFAMVTLAVLLTLSARLVQSALLASILTLVTAYVFYLVAQTYVPRPQVHGADVFSRLLRLVYRSDNPYNAFPSLHVGFSVVLAWHWLWLNRRLGVVFAGWAVLIVSSTVLVHQHYIADLLGGFGIATVASFVSRRITDRAGPLLGIVAREPVDESRPSVQAKP